jgi:hypothetical protein
MFFYHEKINLLNEKISQNELIMIFDQNFYFNLNFLFPIHQLN